MSFFDLTKYRTDEYAQRKLEAENKRLQEEIEMSRYRERRDDYERVQQHHREFEARERAKEEEREMRFYHIEKIQSLRDELEDAKLRHKFGIEVIEK